MFRHIATDKSERKNSDASVRREVVTLNCTGTRTDRFDLRGASVELECMGLSSLADIDLAETGREHTRSPSTASASLLRSYLLTLEDVDHLHYLEIPHQLHAHGLLMGINCFSMTYIVCVALYPNHFTCVCACVCTCVCVYFELFPEILQLRVPRQLPNRSCRCSKNATALHQSQDATAGPTLNA
jgi:hypothetical protein